MIEWLWCISIVFTNIIFILVIITYKYASSPYLCEHNGETNYLSKTSKFTPVINYLQTDQWRTINLIGDNNKDTTIYANNKLTVSNQMHKIITLILHITKTFSFKCGIVYFRLWKLWPKPTWATLSAVYSIRRLLGEQSLKSRHTGVLQKFLKGNVELYYDCDVTDFYCFTCQGITAVNHYV